MRSVDLYSGCTYDTQNLNFPETAAQRPKKGAIMEIEKLGSAGDSLPVLPTQSAQTSSLESSAGATRAKDQVEISEMGRLLDEISRLPDIREEKVAEIREAIASGIYETPEKLEIAVERLLQDVRSQQL